ncbi:WecB/TagA/CpsF family glycosyltransferase [Pseudarthrobacter sp. NamE5]|uniref:WecB/TagA/CpsF family glycosyltransferase n=1 Tax=Pseudarthrobacter sp. NamE5 TaxID=2576839 RepID=UPI00110BBAEF|nr:WecB/TagA/CpsF family glycosyltransferase [Pseudarthrobacter sp. NamE5]TLM85147.1 WecB/TagA/CpsF family glycosyltransferase [Pseudarthrobacter sp. NamE5]
MALDRQRIPLLEVEATPLRVPELVDELSRYIREGSKRTVLGHNLHSVTLTLSDEGFRTLYQQSDVVLLDGAPVLWLWGKTGKAEGPVMDYRLGSTDWLPALDQVEGLERIAVLGAGAAANAEAVRRLQSLVPGARVTGFPGEGWNEDLESKALEWLHVEQPQLVLLGLGMPLQEKVLQRRLDDFPPAVYCAVGGAIEQLAGFQKLAPRWLGRLGLEWAWRLLLHPRRVAYRVLGEPWVLLWLLASRWVMRQLSGRRR